MIDTPITKIPKTLTVLALAATAGLAAVAGAPATAAAHPPRVVGQVWQNSNAASGNAVNVYDRHADGTLSPAGSVATGGLGAGSSLASQGGLARAGNLIFAVNAGDDSVSALVQTKHGLVRSDKIGSGGDFPVSVTVRNGFGYVLNQNDDTITGFRYDGSGNLRRLRHSHRSLTPNPAGGTTGAAQISFTPDGRGLVVTEKATNRIELFELTKNRPGPAKPQVSAGVVPYGFDFDRRGHLIVSEAATGSASSYRVWPFTPITATLADGQAAACWLVVSGHVAYVVNAASNSISTYAIAADGSLTLLKSVAATTEAGPTDAAVSADGRQLLVRVRSGAVGSWQIGPNGSLSYAGSAATGSAFGVAGLVAR